MKLSSAKLLPLVPFVALKSAIVLVHGQTVVTIAGTRGASAPIDGQGTNAAFMSPTKVIPDKTGNFYVIEQGSNNVRRMNASYYVQTIVTSANGGLQMGAVDDDNNLIVTAQNGIIYNVTAKGTRSVVVNSLKTPTGITRLETGEWLVAETHMVSSYSKSFSTSSFIAGKVVNGYVDGAATASRFRNPQGLVIVQNQILVADQGNNAIRSIDTNTNQVTSLSTNGGGWVDGTVPNVQFNSPTDLAVHPRNPNLVFISDTENARIRLLDLSTNQVSTYAGQDRDGSSEDGVGSAAKFISPYGLSFDSDDNLIVADFTDNTIRKICPGTCQPGEYIFAQSPTCCAPCPQGYYQGESGQSGCKICPPGFRCSITEILGPIEVTSSRIDPIQPTETPSPPDNQQNGNQNGTDLGVWLIQLIITVLIALFGFLFIFQLAFVCGYVFGGHSDKWFLRRYFGNLYVTQSDSTRSMLPQ